MLLLADQSSFASFALALAEGSKAVHADTTVIVFFAEIVLMLVAGRLLGELLLRIRQLICNFRSEICDLRLQI